MRIRRFNENLKKNYQQLLEEVDDILQIEVFDDYDWDEYISGIGWEMKLKTDSGDIVRYDHPRFGDKSTDMRGFYVRFARENEILWRGPKSEFIAISIDFHWERISRGEYITQMSGKLNNAIERISQMTGLEQYSPSPIMKNKISGLDFAEGVDGEFEIDWRDPFEQELTILLEDEPEIIRFDILLK